MRKFKTTLILPIYFIFAHLLLTADQQLLDIKDINHVMQEIFKQHVDQKQMNEAILRHSLRVYIDQFDPNRIYLLEQEVNPYLQISDTQLGKMLNEYEQNQFIEFTKLNEIIQKAIVRSRNVRTALENENSVQLFHKSSLYTSDGLEQWSDPDLKVKFATTEEELKQRIENELIKFIAHELRRFGSSYVNSRKVQTLRLFEMQAKEHENQYLYLTENEKPMDDDEKQNIFSIHVLKALASSLDAHTSVLSPSEAYNMRVRLEKEIQGIGLDVQQNNNGEFIISHMFEGGPAAKSGLIQLGDKIIEIDRIPLKNKSLNEVLNMLQGKLGSSISLFLEHAGNENFSLEREREFHVKLLREEIPINEDRVKVSYQKFENGIIGELKLDAFYQSENGITSEKDLREAIKQLDKEGNLKGLILDLRENSGGFLLQAIKTVGLFISNGVVVISKYFNGEEHLYRDMDGKLAYKGPLIVLTSKATASAAEIVAQALQDYGVAVIVGDPHTYGKGTIQSQTVTQNQASTYFKVTVGTYYTVSGKTPQIQGVRSDIIVPSQFTHESMGEEYLDFPLKQDTITPAYNDNLQDIEPQLKPWYMRYYMPTLQRRRDDWESLLPMLKKKSAERIANNKNYQMFLKEMKPTGQERENIEDLQMQEAVNIMKDMIILHSESRGNEPNEELAQPVQLHTGASN